MEGSSRQSEGSAARGMYFRAVLATCVLYGLIRAGLALSNDPATYFDSSRYWQPQEPGSVFDVWTGSMAPSLLPQMLFLLPVRIANLAQGLLGGLAWGFAALTVMYTVRLRVLGCALGMLIMLVGLLPYNAGFDSSVLSESLSISMSLLCLSFAFLVCTRTVVAEIGLSQRTCGLLAAAAYAGAVLSRPSVALLLLPCVGAAALLNRSALRSAAALVSAVTVGLVSVWGIAAAVHETQRAGWFAAADRLAARISPAYLEAARASGLPDCSQLGERLLNTPALSDRLNLVHSEACPELRPWLDAGGLSVVKQTATLPRETIQAWRDENFLQWQPVVFQELKFPLLQWPRFMGQELYIMNRWYYDAYTRLLAFTVGACVTMLIISGATLRRGPRPVRATAALFLVFSGSVVVYSYVVWVLDTYETRHFLPVQAVAPVIAMMTLDFVLREALAGSRTSVTQAPESLP